MADTFTKPHCSSINGFIQHINNINPHIKGLGKCQRPVWSWTSFQWKARERPRKIFTSDARDQRQELWSHHSSILMRELHSRLICSWKLCKTFVSGPWVEIILSNCSKLGWFDRHRKYSQYLFCAFMHILPWFFIWNCQSWMSNTHIFGLCAVFGLLKPFTDSCCSIPIPP